MASVFTTIANGLTSAAADSATSLATSLTSVEDKFIRDDWIWMVVVGFVVAFALAFGIGANDVANTFGTIVGAKVLTLYKACAIASVFELAGAILIGSKVSDTIRKGIIDVHPYNGSEGVLMVGNVATLTGSCVWMILATFFSVPVSGTHSIVGAALGFALVANGARGLNWMKIGLIVVSWIISPILSGGVSVLIFYIIQKFILLKPDQLEPGLKTLPYIYALTIVINVFSVFYEGPPMLGFDKIPLWGLFVISFGSGAICLVIVMFLVVPWQRRIIKDKCEYIRANEEEENITEMVEYIPTGLNSSARNSTSHTRIGSRRMSTTSLDANNDMNHRIPDISDIVNNHDHPPTATKRHDEVEVPEHDTLIKHDGILRGSKRGSARELVANKKKSGTTGAWQVGPKLSVPTTPNKNSASSTPQRSTSFTLDDPNTVEFGRHYEDKAGRLERKRQENEIVSINRAVQRLKSRALITDTLEARFLFSTLQILTSVFGGFAHGGNDVSNAIGPLIGLWIVAQTGNVTQNAPTPIWLLFYGGAGIIVGLWLWGRRVIKTMGEDLTKLTPSSGFCIEIGSALTVLIASNVGIPISTTHCKVGSVVAVGRYRSKENVDWRLFRNIIFAWIVTLPVSGGISAAVFAALRLIIVA
ncbi:sodium-dependent phosphate transporter 1-like [Tubulanus polymorphus]|uniref:sodium-dependent phosphate transporter 1-like n=1 Tax=Tubulanus polymorphus TaxID=672921 RepID=UPI003DA56754